VRSETGLHGPEIVPVGPKDPGGPAEDRGCRARRSGRSGLRMPRLSLGPLTSRCSPAAHQAEKPRSHPADWILVVEASTTRDRAAGRLSNGLFLARTLVSAGVFRPTRPDRAARSLITLQRWGPTLAAGYMGAAARRPEAEAIADERGSLTFEEVHTRTNAIANGLAASGVKQGDGVAILCRNHRGFIEASVACSKLGANALYLNTAFAAPQVREVVERERPVALIYDDEYKETVADAREGRRAFVAWKEQPPGAPNQAADTSGDQALDDLVASAPATTPRPPSEPGRVVILTSGTTGTPKGANRESPTSLAPAAALLSQIPLRAEEPTMIAAPLFHSWGFAHFILSTALSSTLVLRRRFDPLQTLRAIEEHRATALVVVPVMLQRILELGEDALGSINNSTLRVIASSGSELPGPLAQRVMDAFGETLYNLYGSTEVAWATIATPEDLRSAPGTAGKPPRGTVVKILDDQWRELPTGESGRIFVGNELLFEGYTGGGDKVRFGSLMSTGDVGHFDPQGRLFVDGRDDEMIVSGGENVFPAEVENLLARFPGVREVAVVGVPDDEFGQRLSAFIAPTEGAQLNEDELREHVRSNLARYKVPRDIEFVQELPRNATGKILKRELAKG
jgi:acyl-CoA synthetase (AMP-forming)/AMP-acid ligase II